MPADYEREAINRRARAMALARPFFALEQGKGHSDLDLAPFDLGRVALVVLDCVIVEMGGARRGATYERIIEAVRPGLKACQPQSTASDVDRVTSYVIDALTNERERGPFRAEYQVQGDDGAVQWVRFAFKLLDLKETVDGELVLVLERKVLKSGRKF
jgi:hypothetical protein